MDIEKYVKTCDNCQLAGKLPIKVPSKPWPSPTKSWTRSHADFAGPINNTYYLIVVDAFTGWPEISPTKQITAAATEDMLEEISIRHGCPIELISDNGTQFTATSFQNFCQNHGITQKFSAPYYPMSNGRAEIMVSTFKRAHSKMTIEGTIKENLRKFLFTYRTTLTETLNGKTPAEMLNGRKYRMTLDLLLPTKTIASINMKSSDTEQSSKMKQNFDQNRTR